MVEKLCEHFGSKVGVVNNKTYYSFPTIDALAKKGIEQKLRDLGFGYRAKYINQSAQYIQKHHSAEWLYGLRDKPYDEAKSELIKLCGVGAKVGILPTDLNIVFLYLTVIKENYNMQCQFHVGTAIIISKGK